MEPLADVQREQVGRAVRADPGRLRRGGPTAVLAVLAASAVAPVAVAMAAGGAAAAGAALAGAAGNVGAGVITSILDRAVERWRRGTAGPPQEAAISDELAADLLAALQKGDATGEKLTAELLAVLDAVGGIGAALDAATGDLRDHLAACFGDLADQQQATLTALRDLGAGQRRQAEQLHHLDAAQRRRAREQRRRAREQSIQLEEIIDRLRLQSRMRSRSSAPAAQAGGGAQPVMPVFVPYPPASSRSGTDAGWYGGAEVMIGDRRYLIHDQLLAERFTPDHSVLLRQAMGQQLIPAAGRQPHYVWVRQAVIRAEPAGHAYSHAQLEQDALIRERDLLAGLAPAVRGIPLVSYAAEDNLTTSLLVTWPMAGAGVAGQTAGERYGDDGILSAWHLRRLLTGLAGLCDTLASLHSRRITHRCLTPDTIIITDRDRFVLRDLGLATHDAMPGEGPEGYQAPEQSKRGYRPADGPADGPRGRIRPGPATDVYQVAAIAYHLITRHLPDPSALLPARALAPGIPEKASRALDAALAPSPGDRPGIRVFGNALRASSREIT